MNSSLVHLENYAPEDETRTMIRDMIQEREAGLDSNRSLLESARNQKEIASKAVERLRHQLAEAERAEIVTMHNSEAAKKIVSDIEDTIAEHKTLLRSIRCLPFDILCEIFECCIVDEDHKEIMAAAIRLSSVCRTWRFVAHSLGALWRHIDYQLWNPSVKDIFEHFLKRSPYYLDVCVVIDYEFPPLPFSLTNFQFDRIRTLTITISPYSLHLWSPTLHNLTQLTIHGAGEIPLENCLCHCENIEELELYGSSFSFNGDFVLPGLARISFEAYSTSLFLGRLFERAPHLKSFSFSDECYMGTGCVLLDEHNLRPLHELTSLRVYSYSSRHAIVPLLEDSSLLPSLRHLTLASSDMSNLLDSVVQHSSTVSLTKLTLEIHTFTEFGPSDDLVPRLMVLRRLQYVERLEVDAGGRSRWYPGSKYPEYLVDCLCEVLSECAVRPIFPSLRIIRFLCYEAVSVDNIIEMVKTRMAAAKVSPEMLAPLESVTFEDREPLDVDQYRRLKVALGHNAS